MDLITLLPIINVLGFIFLGLGYILVQFKLGGRGVSTEVINTYKEQVVQLKEELKATQDQATEDRHTQGNALTALKLDIAKMQGILQEKDKKIEELTNIFQGKSPEQEQYMKDMRSFTQGVALYMKDSAEILSGIKDFMLTLNEKAVANQNRNEKIDQATQSEVGKVLRKK